MTTDPFPKEYAVEVQTAAGTFRVGGMAKGSGMIEPRMATMLGYLTTDAAVDPLMLSRALTEASPLHLQRDHRRRRAVDQRLRVRAGQRRQRRRDRRRPLPCAVRRVPRGRARARARHRARRRRRHQADRDHGHRRVVGAGRLDGGARDREFAAGEDRGPRRRSELGPAGRGGRPIGCRLRARRRTRADWPAGAVRERPAVRRARAEGGRLPDGQGPRRSKSISAPADLTPRRSGPATSPPST